MGLTDIILFPFYVFFFYIIFYFRRKRYEDPLLRKYHKYGFWVKVFSAIAFTIFGLYISPGDSVILYHNEGNDIYHIISRDSGQLKIFLQKGENFNLSLLKDLRNEGYYASEANFMVIKMVALFSFITFGKYILINLIFSLIAFTGTWRLFLFFYKQYPNHHKKFALAILYLPTFVFWSSGILKDPISIAALGWITYSLYEIFCCKKKGVIKNLILLLIFGYMLATIKVYILISYLPIFILFIILKNIERITSRLFKYLITSMLIVISIFGFNRLLISLNDELNEYAVSHVTKTVKNLNESLEAQSGPGAESNFSLGLEFDGSAKGLLKIAPIAIGTTLFRPFLWESHKPSSLMAALESLLIMMFTLYVICKAGIFRFIKIILKDPLIFYCFLFALVFALFVGASTPNFGTLVRYKIPCMPFYLISMFLIYGRVKEKAKTATSKLITDTSQFPLPTPAY
jgi:hypothetical protein